MQVFLIQEGSQVVAYAPALELSTYGNSKEDAREDAPHKNLAQEKENFNLEDLKQVIERYIDVIWEFYHQQNTATQQVIRLYAKSSKLGFIEGALTDNQTSFTEARLKQFLREYNNKFKQPLEESLKDYYRVFFNPTLVFEGKLLDQLNLKPCSYCHSGEYSLSQLHIPPPLLSL